MDPAIVALIIQAGIKYGPTVVMGLYHFAQKALDGKPITEADVTAAFGPMHTPMREGLLAGVLVPDPASPGSTTVALPPGSTIKTPPPP
jgi:hypothetical protein